MPVVFWLVFAVVAVLVVVQGLAFLEVVRQLADIRDQLDGEDVAQPLDDTIPLGSALPPETLLSMSNPTARVLSDETDPTISALVFLHPACLTCHRVAPMLQRFARMPSLGVKVLAVIEGSSSEDADGFARERHVPTDIVVIDTDGSLARALNIKVRPAAIIVRGGRLVFAASIRSGDQFETFVRESLRKAKDPEMDDTAAANRWVGVSNVAEQAREA